MRLENLTRICSANFSKQFLELKANSGHPAWNHKFRFLYLRPLTDSWVWQVVALWKIRAFSFLSDLSNANFSFASAVDVHTSTVLASLASSGHWNPCQKVPSFSPVDLFEKPARTSFFELLIRHSHPPVFYHHRFVESSFVLLEWNFNCLVFYPKISSLIVIASTECRRAPQHIANPWRGFFLRDRVTSDLVLDQMYPYWN